MEVGQDHHRHHHPLPAPLLRAAPAAEAARRGAARGRRAKKGARCQDRATVEVTWPRKSEEAQRVPQKACI